MDGNFDVRPGPLAPWCPRVAAQSKSSCQATAMRKPHPSTTRDHLGIGCYFASLFHVAWLRAPSVCRAWATAEWQVPSENMAHNVNARQACGLRKDCSCPSLFQTSSVTAKADVMALSSLKNLFADISPFCHPTERSWRNVWLWQKICQMSSWFRFDW